MATERGKEDKMSFFLASENGFVSDVATAQGWNDVIDFVDEHLPAASPLSDFCNTGVTTNIQGVVGDIVKILPSVNDKAVRSILQELKTNLAKVKEIAIISQ